MRCVGKQALRCAKQYLGSEKAVAAVVSRSQPYVHAVLKESEGEVPAEWCIPLQDATADKGARIPRAAFRPDLYPGESSDHVCFDKRAAANSHRESGVRNHRQKRAGAA